MLKKFGSGLDQMVRACTSEVMEKAAKQFDPADPSSPMAKHAAALAAQQKAISDQLEKSHSVLEGGLKESVSLSQ